MKHLLSSITVLMLLSSGCANVPTATGATVKNRIEVVGGYDLPVPDDARITGKVTQTGTHYMLSLETSLPPNSAQEFYAQTLKEKGWLTSIANEGGGLIANPDSDFYKDYCYGEREAILGVETSSVSAEKTAIRLTLHTIPDTWPCERESIPENLELIYDHIPALRAPERATMGLGTANTGEAEAQTTLTLIGDLSAAEVADFYNEQLLAAGWRKHDRGDKEGAAWSNWTSQDKQGSDWIGALIVIKAAPESNNLFAVVTVEKIK